MNKKNLNANALSYSTTQINREWKIKVKGVGENKGINTLVGVSGLIRLLGLEFAEKFVVRAFRDMLDKVVCKLRGQFVVTFYAN